MPGGIAPDFAIEFFGFGQAVGLVVGDREVEELIDVHPRSSRPMFGIWRQPRSNETGASAHGYHAAVGNEHLMAVGGSTGFLMH